MDVGVEAVYGCGCGGGILMWVWRGCMDLGVAVAMQDRMKIVIICAC